MNEAKAKKKILMLAPTPFFSDRGCHIRVLNSYLMLEKKGHDVMLLTYPVGRDALHVKLKRISNLPGYKKTSPGFSFYKPFLDVLMYFKARKEMKKENYDLIYAHLHEGALIGTFLKKKFKKRLIFDSQGSLVGELIVQKTIKEGGFFSKILFKLERYITQRPDEIITSTEGLKQFIIKEFNYKNPIKVVKDFPDKDLFNPQVKPADLNLPKDKKIVVYLGGLQLYKGINYLIEAIPLVNESFHFLIMGHPVDDAKRLADKLGILNKITFTGKIPYEKASSHLALGDIAVSPKTLESGEANAKIYNYIAMNLPVVCFDMPETRQIAEEFPEAKMYFAKEKNVKDLAKVIEKVKI